MLKNPMNRFMIRFFVVVCACISAIFLPGCGNGGGKGLRIGIDPNWYPQNFQGQEAYVNGYVEELLLEISKYSGLEFQRVNANWDTLLDGLHHHRYDAVLSSLPPYNFNTAKYDFSRDFLNVGPVLITKINSEAQELKDMTDKVIGILSVDQQLLIMQKYPDILIRNYNLASDALAALKNREVEGVIIDRLTAISFLRGIYAGQLKVAGGPLNDLSLRLVTMKDAHSGDLKKFNKSLQYLAKKKKLQKLQKKWRLDDSKG